MKLPSTLPFVRRSRLIAPVSVIGLGLFGLAAWSLAGQGFAASTASNSSVFVRPGAARRGSDASALGAVSNGIVIWVHIGDLHTQSAAMQHYKDFPSILQELNQEFAGGVNFAVLPGDNGNEGSDSKYKLIGPGATSSSPLPGPAVTATNTEIATATLSLPGAGTGVTLQSGDRILLMVLAMAILAVALIVTLGIVAAR